MERTTQIRHLVLRPCLTQVCNKTCHLFWANLSKKEDDVSSSSLDSHPCPFCLTEGLLSQVRIHRCCLKRLNGNVSPRPVHWAKHEEADHPQWVPGRTGCSAGIRPTLTEDEPARGVRWHRAAVPASYGVTAEDFSALSQRVS